MTPVRLHGTSIHIKATASDLVNQERRLDASRPWPFWQVVLLVAILSIAFGAGLAGIETELAARARV